MLVLSAVKKGANKITLAQIDPSPERGADLGKCCTLYQAEEVLDATWWYAKWQVPELFNDKSASGPAFFRTTFTAEATTRPLMAELTAGTKGQVYLNGWNVGRYFIAGAKGRKVGPQKSYYLPEPWLKAGENELVLFDEHGVTPGVKFTY